MNKLDKKSHGHLYLKDILYFIGRVDGGIIHKNIKLQMKTDKNH